MRTPTSPWFGLLFAAALVSSGCGGTASSGGTASVRVVNASMDYASVDLYLDEKRKIASVDYESASDYLKVDADTYAVEFRRAGATGSLDAFDEDLASDERLTWLVLGSSGAFQALAVDETHAAADKGRSLVRLVNGAADAGAVDVYLTDETTALADVAPTYADVGATARTTVTSA